MVKNGLPTYQKAIIKAFCEYIDVFMKIFLDGWNHANNNHNYKCNVYLIFHV